MKLSVWELRKPLLGIKIHSLKDENGNTSKEGQDPFLEKRYWPIPIFTLKDGIQKKNTMILSKIYQNGLNKDIHVHE